MEMKPVKSSMIEEIGFHDNGVMHVQFKGGKIYHYTGISKELYENLMKSESKGKFLNTHKLKGKPGHHPEHKPKN